MLAETSIYSDFSTAITEKVEKCKTKNCANINKYLQIDQLCIDQ